MAENTEDRETPSEDSESLDHLLRSALEDFDSYSPPSEDINAACATASNNTLSTEKLQSTEEKLLEDFENKFKNLFMKDDMDEAAFSTQMSDLLNEAQKEIQSHVYNPNSPTNNDDNTDTVSQAIGSMMQNIEQMKENIKDQTPEGFIIGDTFMEQMMQTLMSKEVLYPSLLCVKQKYPSWLNENKSNTTSEELDRFTKQYEIIGRICMLFETENNSDSAELKQKRFVELMSLLQKMTDLGQPPQDLTESLPLGMQNEIFGSNTDPNTCNPM